MTTQVDVLQLADRVRKRVPNEKTMRFVEAYLMMALRARYRPAAPSDGFGNIQLTIEQCGQTERLLRESIDYAVRFDKEEDTRDFGIGCSNFATNRAFVFAIEAARVLASGDDGDATALQLLQLAVEEVKAAEQQQGAVQQI